MGAVYVGFRGHLLLLGLVACAPAAAGTQGRCAGADCVLQVCSGRQLRGSIRASACCLRCVLFLQVL
jgi:hypothetical protein